MTRYSKLLAFAIALGCVTVCIAKTPTTNWFYSPIGDVAIGLPSTFVYTEMTNFNKAYYVYVGANRVEGRKYPLICIRTNWKTTLLTNKPSKAIEAVLTNVLKIPVTLEAIK